VRVADVPALTGVAKMAADNWLGSLDEHGYLTIGPDPAASRFRVARLTARGSAARDSYFRWAQEAKPHFLERNPPGVPDLRNSAERLVTGPGQDSPLRRGVEPYPDGWRAQVPRPSTLPHYPVVSHRGGFPDGS
jgi:hypothetical protein